MQDRGSRMPVAQPPDATALQQALHSVVGTVRCLRSQAAGGDGNGRLLERYAGGAPLNDDLRVVLVKVE